MTRFRKGTITCPCCQERYAVDIIYSTIWSGDVSTDLLRHTLGKMPINYLVHTCPRCGWSGKGEFPEPEPEKIRSFIREKITPVLGKEPVRPWRSWEFFAWISEAAGGADLELAESFLLASQCARLGRQPGEEERLRRQAIEYFKKALEKGEVPEDSLYKITYLLGELHRRSGDTWKADEWFRKVLDLDLDHATADFFKGLARSQMEQPGEIIGEKPGATGTPRKKTSLPGFIARLIPRNRGK